MSNIMLRFADTHNLTVGLPLEGKWELGGYPAFIDHHLIGMFYYEDNHFHEIKLFSLNP